MATKPQENSVIAAPIPVVGIGYSAGGLEPVQKLLHAIGAETGFAFVVVQHLKEDQESHLSAILAKSTRMPVRSITNSLQVEPNVVFVLPPGFDVILSGDFLNLSPRGEGAIHHLGIDFFLSSLSQSRGSRAIGVLLSGTGSDGTLGLKAIKSEGGVTIVQDPKTARFDGMPRSAIASGVADLILQPEEIADELKRIAKHPYTVAAVTDEPPAPNEAAGQSKLQQILDILLHHTRLDFSKYKLSTIRRRIERQMMLRKLATVEKYAEYLRKNPEEVKSLYEDIFIHVTDFFRDPEAFAALKEKVFPGIVEGKGKGKPVRLWVPGCATGEEVYSLAISLTEYLEENGLGVPFNVFAGDISEPAVQAARKGLFADYQMKSVSAKRLERFFDKVKGGYKVKKELRDLCIFSRHDLTNNPPIPNVDLVSCRNVLIYFSAELQKRVIPVFHYALNAGGFLWLGRAESPESSTKLFRPVDKSHRIYAKVSASASAQPRFSTSSFSSVGAEASLRSAINTAPGPSSSADQVILYRYSPPSVVVGANFEILQFRGRTVPYLEPSPGSASYNLLKMANPDLVAPLRVALSAARKQDTQARKEDVPFEFEGKKRKVSIDVSPLNPAAPAKDRQYLVVFEDGELRGRKAKAPPVRKLTRGAKDDGQLEALSQYNTQLQHELDAAREYQQSLIEEYETAQEELTSANEELRSTNEELQSTNEELHSANEELGGAKEELQAANEELQSTNEEVHRRNSELEQTMRELEASELRFRLMIENVRDYAIFRLDPQGNVVTWNEGARRFKGYEAEEIIGQHFSKFYPPEDKDWKPKMELVEAARLGRFEDEGWRVRKDGSRFWANVVITALRDAKGTLVGFAKVSRDLTERRNLEQDRLERQRQELELRQLRESEEQFRSLANSLPQLTWTADADGHITWYNRRWYEYTGATLEQMEGWGWQSVHDPRELPRVLRLWKGAIEKGTGVEMEFPLRGADGRYRWFLTLVEPVKDASGKVLRWFGTNTDIDEKRRGRLASEVLASASAVFNQSLDYEKTLQSLADMLVAQLGDWCSIAVVMPGVQEPKNAAVAHPDSAKLTEVRELFRDYPPDWNAPQGAPNVLRTGKAELYKEIPQELLRKAARDERHFGLLRSLGMTSAMAVPLKARGKVLGAITLISSNPARLYSEADLALAEEIGRRAGTAVDNALLYRQAQEAIHTRDEFLSIASHELKTPLTSLQIQAQLRERNVQKGNAEAFSLEKLKKMFDGDRKQLNRLTRLIDDMLDVTRIASKKLALRLEPTDLCAVVKDILERLSSQFAAAESRVTIESCTEAVGQFDRYRIEQVVVNLLTNALKYGGGQPVHVSLERQGDLAVLKVRDEGIGIARKDQERIFQQFERATNSSVATGLGLGLYIARQIVEGHGGTVRVESELGRGATFIVELPLRA